MFIAKIKATVATVLVLAAVATLATGGLVYSGGGQATPPSELEALRSENELLKINLRVTLEKIKALESEVASLKGINNADAMLQPAVGKVRKAAQRTQSMNNLKQIGLAMHNHHGTFNHFPARASFDKNGKPLLSWRVHILPYIQQQELYKLFKLDEPWDSPANKKLIARMPSVYASPFNKVGKDGKTTYLVVTGKGSMFEGNQGLRVTDVTDGTSNTIMVVEANDKKAVYWTQPQDFPIDTEEPLEGLVNPVLNGFNAAFADGSVRFLPAAIRPATLQALFTSNGGEIVNPDDF